MTISSTNICNQSLTRIGSQVIDSISGTDTVSVKCNLLYTQSLEELTTEGPLNGWKFATRRQRKDREAMTITAVADLVTGSTVTVTITNHTLVAGDLVNFSDTDTLDGQYEVLTITGTTDISVSATFVATETGTAKWTSERYFYRFTRPTGFRVDSAQVGGIELSDWIREGAFILTNQADSDVDFVYIQSMTDTTLFPPQFTRVLVLKLAIQLVYALNQDHKAIQGLEFDLDRAMSKAIAMDEREKYVREFSSSWQDVGHTRDTLEREDSSASGNYDYGTHYY